MGKRRKKKSTQTISWKRLLAVPAGIIGVGIAISASAFAIDRAQMRESIPRNTIVYGINVGTMTLSDAMITLEESIDAISKRTFSVQVASRGFQVTGKDFGVAFDREHIQSLLTSDIESFGCGPHNIVCEFVEWGKSLVGKRVLIQDPPIRSDAFERTLVTLEKKAKLPKPEIGSVIFQGTTPSPRYPAFGRSIDRSRATTLVTEHIRTTENAPTMLVLPIIDVSSPISPEVIDAKVADARRFVKNAIRITHTNPDVPQFLLTPDMIAQMLKTEPDLRHATLVFAIDPNQLEQVFQYHIVRNATFDVSDPNRVLIIPSQKGIAIDPVRASEKIMAALMRDVRTLDFSEFPVSDAQLSTEAAEALGIKHLIAEYTTFHPCCQNRVKNIHLVADILDNTVVLPGQSLNVNKHIGERTEKRGFLPGGTIVGGELTDTIGGGISQFATTFYNAVYWSGFQHIVSLEHGFYFSRYPEGIEATMSWPYPDLIFTNDYPTPILIKTRYTSTSITVGIYGDNDGRVFIGSYRDRNANHRIPSLGGADARHVNGSIGARYNIKPEPATIYRPDSVIPRGSPKMTQEGGPGWSVDMKRIVTSPTISFEQQKTVRYYPHPTIYRMHPCDIPGADQAACGN